MATTDLLILALLIVLLGMALWLTRTGLGLALNRADDPRTGRQHGRWVDRQWRLERRIYRHHRLIGLLVIAAGAYFIFKTWQLGVFTSTIDERPWLPAWWLLLAGNGVNLVIGLVLLLRPSRLKPLEHWSNHWVDLDPRRLGPWLARYPRLRGLLIMAVSLICAIGFAVLLVHLAANPT